MMPARPLISFCLFAFEQEQYVEEAVAGALAQTYSPLEIVISDDGSSDATFEAIERAVRDYAGPHRIVLSRNERNLGLGAHVNRVLGELAQGEWFVMAAGDDVSLPDRVERIWNAIAQDSTARMVHSAVTRVDEKGAVLGTVPAPLLDLERAIRECIHGATAAYHREVVDRCGPIDPIVRFEDRVLAFRALLLGTSVAIDPPLVRWRRHGNNLSGRLGTGAVDQVAFSLGEFERMKLLASIQKLRDLLALDAGLRARIPDVPGVEERLLAAIADEWRVSTYARSYFFGEFAPRRLAADPRLRLLVWRKLAGAWLGERNRQPLSRGLLRLWRLTQRVRPSRRRASARP
ncbi:MAG: glycosyltransferase [Burkholderiaceae bacterium]|nr:glycosyltransferase [Burkholderiaceae bacterium]